MQSGDLPVGFERLATSDGMLEQALHSALDITFALVSGGEFDMGLREADVAALSRAVPHSKWTEDFVARLERTARPVHRVRVAPFWVAIRPTRTKQVRRVPGWESRVDTFERGEALRFAADAGFRVPSEAELEWLAREGNKERAFVYDGAAAFHANGVYPNTGPWGIMKLTVGEWASDDWHPSYEGAPSDGRPWLGGDAEGVTRGFLPLGVDQDERDLARGLSCNRAPGRPPGENTDHFRQMVRLAFDASTR